MPGLPGALPHAQLLSGCSRVDGYTQASPFSPLLSPISSLIEDLSPILSLNHPFLLLPSCSPQRNVVYALNTVIFLSSVCPFFPMAFYSFLFLSSSFLLFLFTRMYLDACLLAIINSTFPGFLVAISHLQNLQSNFRPIIVYMFPLNIRLDFFLSYFSASALPFHFPESYYLMLLFSLSLVLTIHFILLPYSLM